MDEKDHLVSAETWKKFDELVDSLIVARWVAWFPVGLEHNGRRVMATLTRGRFGPTWAMTDEHGKYTGVFITNRPASLKKRGYRVMYEQAQAHVELVGPTATELEPAIVRDHDRVPGGLLAKPED